MSEHRDREHVAPGVRRVHTRECARSQGVRRRCSCDPSYAARVKVGPRGRHREVSATFLTLAEATRWREDTLAGIDGRRSGPVPTLGEAAESYVGRIRSGSILNRSGRPYSARTIEAHEGSLRVHVLPLRDRASGLPLSDLPADRLLSPRTLQAVATDLGDAGHSRAVVRNAMQATRAVLRYLYESGYTDTPPPSGVRVPPPPPRRKRVYSADERAALLDAAGLDDLGTGRSLIYPLLALLDGTGLRIGEVLALRWGPGGVMVGPEGGVVRVTEAKTSTGIREVPIGPRIAAVLVQHRQATEGVEGAPVFADENGQPYSRHGAPRYALRRVAKAANVQGVTNHAFRHTHATVLGTRPEVDAVTLAARLGHADPAFTARTYIHRDDDRARALATLADDLHPFGP
jgi:integrase